MSSEVAVLFFHQVQIGAMLSHHTQTVTNWKIRTVVAIFPHFNAVGGNSDTSCCDLNHLWLWIRFWYSRSRLFVTHADVNCSPTGRQLNWLTDSCKSAFILCLGIVTCSGAIVIQIQQADMFLFCDTELRYQILQVKQHWIAPSYQKFQSIEGNLSYIIRGLPRHLALVGADWIISHHLHKLTSTEKRTHHKWRNEMCC